MKYPYPLQFKPVYKDYLWGGTGFAEKFGRDLPGDVIAESWEVSAHPNGMSIVANGELAGKSLPEIMETYGRDLMGSNATDQELQRFPLLLKFLDANDYLSVQVHPDDEYALKNNIGDTGKSEAWYILDAKPGAEIVYGLKEGTTKEDFANAIAEGRVFDCLRTVTVQPGEMYNVPPGVVHAVGAGVMVAEIQQNSDAVYRVYDWDRKDASGNTRELHIEQALESIDFDSESEKVTGKRIEVPGGTKVELVANEYFVAQMLEVDDLVEETNDGSYFILLSVLEGDGEIRWAADSGKEQTVEFKAGNSFMIPASLGAYSIKGPCKVFKSFPAR